MINLIRAELFKMRTTPGPWVVVGVTVLLTGLGITVSFIVSHHGAATHFGAPTTPQQLRSLVGAGYLAAVVMAPVLGVISITSEYRHKVLTATLLLHPKRGQVLTAKVAASLLWGVFLCVCSLAMVAAMGIPLLITQGGSVHALYEQVGPVVPGLFGAYALLAVYGLGIGTVVRNQIGGVILALGITLVIEPIIVMIFSHLAHMDVNFLPSLATRAVAGGLVDRGGGGASIGVSGLLSWWLGALALVGWGLGTTILGYFTTFRRDIN
jgi:ABC-type transport system involved in multi-copper enzyme maturation permease subunit